MFKHCIHKYLCKIKIGVTILTRTLLLEFFMKAEKNLEENLGYGGGSFPQIM